MSVTLKWDGLAAFEAELDTMSSSLTAEADPIVKDAAYGASTDIKTGYPFRSGDLRSHVFVSRFDKGKDVIGYLVKNTAALAFIFENGTQARHYFTKAKGVLHATGRMPPGHVFVPAVIKRRRAMYARLKDLLVKRGLVVSGDA